MCCFLISNKSTVCFPIGRQNMCCFLIGRKKMSWPLIGRNNTTCFVTGWHNNFFLTCSVISLKTIYLHSNWLGQFCICSNGRHLSAKSTLSTEEAFKRLNSWRKTTISRNWFQCCTLYTVQNVQTNTLL